MGEQAVDRFGLGHVERAHFDSGARRFHPRDDLRCDCIGNAAATGENDVAGTSLRQPGCGFQSKSGESAGNEIGSIRPKKRSPGHRLDGRVALGEVHDHRIDRKVVVEAAVPNAREIECAVLGNDAPEASIPGEIISSREFYDYEAKYLDEGSRSVIPAALTPAQTAEVRARAIDAYRAIDCAGMARVDFLLAGDTGMLYVNEVNTIPGFTTISMYGKMWEASGLSYPRLLDRLIELAIERHAEKQGLRTSM